MRFLLALLLTALLCFITGLYLPWWSIAIIAFLVGCLVPQSAGRSFLSGFLGVFFLWMILAFWIDAKNDCILSQKIAMLFGLGSVSIMLIFITAIVGAIVGGFAALSGNSLRPGIRS
jgi:hypothetical protein